MLVDIVLVVFFSTGSAFVFEPIDSTTDLLGVAVETVEPVLTVFPFADVVDLAPGRSSPETVSFCVIGKVGLVVGEAEAEADMDVETALEVDDDDFLADPEVDFARAFCKGAGSASESRTITLSSAPTFAVFLGGRPLFFVVTSADIFTGFSSVNVHGWNILKILWWWY